MISSDFRIEARRKLDGKWGKAVLIVLADLLISFILGSIRGGIKNSTMYNVFSIVYFIIEVPLQFGLFYAFFKLYRGENVGAFDYLKLAFKNFGRSWVINFYMILKLIAPILLIIVSTVIMAFGMAASASDSIFLASGVTSSYSGFGTFLMFLGVISLIASMVWCVVKSYYYQLAYMVAFDNPNMLPKDCVLRSQELMTDRRGKLFCLQFSFIGWAILAVLTFGIGYLWLIPYIQFAIVAFYDAFAHNGGIEAEVVADKSDDLNDDGPIQ